MVQMEHASYVRSLTQNPDYDKIKTLPIDEQENIFRLRNAMHSVYRKVSDLKKELDNREYELAEEQNVRQSLEERLKKFVNIYENEELRKELNEKLVGAKPQGLQVAAGSAVDITDELHEPLRSLKADIVTNVQNSPQADISMQTQHATTPTAEVNTHYGGHNTNHVTLQSKGGNTQHTAAQTDRISIQQEMTQASGQWTPLAPSYPPVPFWTPSWEPAKLVCQKCGEQLSSRSDNYDKKDTRKSRTKTRYSSDELDGIWAELDKMKELNEKLRQQLHHTRSDSPAHIPENVDITGIYTPGDIGKLVENIYRAQKERDSAILGQVNLAIEERQHLLDRLEKERAMLDPINKPIARGPRGRAFTTDPPAVGQTDPCPTEPSSHIHRELSEQIAVDKANLELDMEDLLREREDILEKMWEVEEENLDFAHRLHEQEVLWEERLAREAIHYDEIEDERDVILQHYDDLQHEVEALQCVSKSTPTKSVGLQTTLNDPTPVNHPPEESTNTDHVTVDHVTIGEMDPASNKWNWNIPVAPLKQVRTDHVAKTVKMVTDLSDEEADRAWIKALREQRDQLTKQLLVTEERLKSSFESQERLERLVNVLRRKIKSIGLKSEE